MKDSRHKDDRGQDDGEVDEVVKSSKEDEHERKRVREGSYEEVRGGSPATA